MPDAARDRSEAGADQTLSPAGLIVLAAVIATVTAAVAVAVESAGAVRAANRLGETLVLRTDAWLDRVDAELEALEVAGGAADGCGEAEREVLLRASLRSSAAQAFVRIARAGDGCGPSATRAFVEATDGIALPGPPTATPVAGAPARLALRPAATLAGGALALRPSRDGAVLVALLEPRWMLDGPQAPAAAFAASPSYAVVALGGPPLLLDARGASARAVALGVGGTRGATGAAGALGVATHASARWPVAVVTAVEPAAIAARLEDRAAAWVAFALALLGGAVALGQQGLRRRDRPEARLRRALRKRRFEPVVQPIVDARSGRCVGGEVLLRLAHPIRGLVSPVEFIALAEATGLIGPIFDLLVAKARDQLAPIARRHPDLVFAFNLAPSQLQDPALADRLVAVFDDASLPPARVLLEITERDAVDEAAARGVTALKERGFRVAIDDFGTGQSSLATLERLRVDRIKIDREFVRRIDEPGAGTVVLDAIVGLAQRLGTPLVAEGVETDAQRRWLAQRGVDCLQGYLFARPMTVADFAAWLDRPVGEGAFETHAALRPAAGGDAPPTGVPRGHGFVLGAGARVAELDPAQVASWMRGPGGVDLRDRNWRLRTWPASFVGGEAVDWFVDRLGLTRAQAVRLGQRMAALGLIEHVAQEHDFADAMLFYRFRDAVDRVAAAGEMPSVDLRALVHEMRGDGGLRLQSHDWRGVRYRRAFTGARATRWLERRLGIDRPAAEAVGQALLRSGAIRHVDDERGYRSGPDPFRFG